MPRTSTAVAGERSRGRVHPADRRTLAGGRHGPRGGRLRGRAFHHDLLRCRANAGPRPVRRTEHLRRPLPGRSRQPRKRCEGAVATSGLQPDRRSQCALSALRRTGTASGVYRPLRNRSQGSDRDFAPGDLIVSTRTVSHPGRSSSYARSARARSSSRTRQAISMAFSAVNTTAIQTWPKTSGRMAISRDATQ